MTEWWNPATYLGLEGIVSDKGFTPLNLAISGSGATNTLHSSSDVDIFGTFNETGPTLLFPGEEVAAYLGLASPPSIRMIVRDRPTNLLKLSSDAGSKCKKVWELERILLYPKIYENPLLTPSWKAAASSLAKKTVGNWYLRASYEQVPLFDDPTLQTSTLLHIQMAIRMVLSGAYYLENNSFLVDAKSLFSWAGISFDWVAYDSKALENVSVPDYASPLKTGRDRLETDLSLL